jgi:hypothetical protein
VPLSTVAALSTLARTHVLDVTVRDAWAHSARATLRLEVTNRSPVVRGTTVPVRSVKTERAEICCYWEDHEDDCGGHPTVFSQGDGAFADVEDPDGDPVDVTYGGTSTLLQLSRSSAAACSGSDCAVGLHLAATGTLDSCAYIAPIGSLRVLVTDGVSSAERALPLVRY